MAHGRTNCERQLIVAKDGNGRRKGTLSADTDMPFARIIGTECRNFRAEQTLRMSRKRLVRRSRGDPMTQRLTQALDFHAQALLLRAERSRVLAGNIANADTPHYKARDFDFRAALTQAVGGVGSDATAPLRISQERTAAGHLQGQGAAGGSPALSYRTPLQTSLDANTVDMDMERASFADNTLRYEASLRFLNGQIRTMLTAINGQ
jgi:flagellar basal-body rod protein FlgB